MRHALRRYLVLLGLLWLTGIGHASANTCTATMTNIDFGEVSPIDPKTKQVSGTLQVSCVLTDLIAALLPNISYCVSLGEGSGGIATGARTLMAGNVRLPYNLYRENSYETAAVWGGNNMASYKTPIKGVMAGLLGLGVFTHTYTVYGQLRSADLNDVPTIDNGPTNYISSFATDAVLRYTFSILLPFDACVVGTQASVPFQVSALVINDCEVNAGNLDFGSSKLLSGALRTSATLSARCTKNNAYRITLNGGLHASGAERRMKNSVTGETVRYRLSSSLDGGSWGDGSGTGSAVGAVGSGSSQSVTVYGLIPAQATPSPGDYRDTITATITY